MSVPSLMGPGSVVPEQSRSMENVIVWLFAVISHGSLLRRAQASHARFAIHTLTAELARCWCRVTYVPKLGTWWRSCSSTDWARTAISSLKLSATYWQSLGKWAVDGASTDGSHEVAASAGRAVCRNGSSAQICTGR